MRNFHEFYDLVREDRQVCDQINRAFLEMAVMGVDQDTLTEAAIEVLDAPDGPPQEVPIILNELLDKLRNMFRRESGGGAGKTSTPYNNDSYNTPMYQHRQGGLDRQNRAIDTFNADGQSHDQSRINQELGGRADVIRKSKRAWIESGRRLQSGFITSIDSIVRNTKTEAPEAKFLLRHFKDYLTRALQTMTIPDFDFNRVASAYNMGTVGREFSPEDHVRHDADPTGANYTRNLNTRRGFSQGAAPDIAAAQGARNAEIGRMKNPGEVQPSHQRNANWIGNRGNRYDTP